MDNLMHGQIVEAEILSHTLTSKGQAELPCLEIKTNAEGEPLTVLIWLSEKAIDSGVVRKQLDLCGFTDDMSLKLLNDEPKLLAGNRVRVEVDVNGNFTNGKIVLGAPKPKAEAIAKLDAMLKPAPTVPPANPEDLF